MLQRTILNFSCWAALYAIMALPMFSGPLFCQNLQWAKGFAATQNTIAQGIVVKHNALGDIYVAGRFRGTVDFDHGPSNVSIASNGANYDIFVMKTNSYGNFKWVRTFGSTSDELVGDIALDTAGNVFIAGSFAGLTDFDGGSGTIYRTPTATSDIYFLKLDSNGNFLSVFQYGTTGDNVANDLAIDSNGNLLMTGEFRGSIDFDPGPGSLILTGTSTISADMFVQKLNPAGNLLWAKRLGAGGNDKGMSVETDSTGNVVIGGYFQSTPDFDPSAGTFPMTASGITDIYILKLSASGNFMWAKRMGAPGAFCHLDAIAIGSAGQIVSVGDFGATADFDPGAGVVMLPHVGGYDIYVQCLDASGNLMWVQPFGTVNNDIASDVGLDSLDNVFVAGTFLGSMDFDPSPTATFMVNSYGGSSDAYVECLAPNGNFVWNARIGGVLADGVNAIDVYPDGTNVFTGRYGGTVDCDPGPLNYTLQPLGNNVNIYVMELGACIASRATMTSIACDSFVYHGTVYQASGTYEQVLTNHINCDSFVTLQLEVREPTSSNLVIDTCGTYWLNGQSFANSGNYTQVIPNNAGCDSTITLALTTHPNSATTIIDSTCATYNLNGQVFTQSGIYTQVLNNAIGCDSVITLQLSVLQTARSQTVAACDSFNFGGQTLDSSGTYSMLYVNQFGCDSLEIINLTITQFQATISQTGNDLTAGPNGGIYQWVDCNNNDLPIAGATAQTYTPTTSGNYAVVVDYGPCSERSACIPVTIVGTAATQAPEVSCYPIPTTGRVVVDLGRPDDAAIKLMTLQGQILKTLISTQQTQIGVELPSAAGIYFLKVDVRGESTVIKVIRL